MSTPPPGLTPRARPRPPRAAEPARALALALLEERPQVVVQEEPLRVEAAPRGDERVRARVALEELLAREEVQLAPVDARVEGAEQAVDLAQVRPVVGAGDAGDGEDDGVALVAVREESVVARDGADLEREDGHRQAAQHQLARRRERVAAGLERHEVLELV